MKHIIQWIKSLYSKAKYPTLYEAIVAAAIQIMTLAVLFSDFFTFLGDSSKLITIAIAIILSAILIVTNWVLLRRINEYRRELLERNKFIEFIVQKFDPEYKIDYLEDTHEIMPNGDGYFSRRVILSYIGKDVAWYEMGMGTTSKFGAKSKTGEFWVRSYPDMKTLAKVLYKDIVGKLFYAIVLDPILTKDNPKSGFEFSREWEGVWGDFIESGKDTGKFTAKYEIEELKFKITAPKPFQFIEFNVSQNIGQHKVIFDNRGRSVIEFLGRNIKPGTYSYEVKAQKVLNLH